MCVRVVLTLSLTGSTRGLQDTVTAVDLAVKALEVKPNSFEAYYARARAKRDER